MDSLGKYAANTGILATLAAVVPQHPTLRLLLSAKRLLRVLSWKLGTDWSYNG